MNGHLLKRCDACNAPANQRLVHGPIQPQKKNCFQTKTPPSVTRQYCVVPRDQTQAASLKTHKHCVIRSPQQSTTSRPSCSLSCLKQPLLCVYHPQEPPLRFVYDRHSSDSRSSLPLPYPLNARAVTPHPLELHQLSQP